MYDIQVILQNKYSKMREGCTFEFSEKQDWVMDDVLSKNYSYQQNHGTIETERWLLDGSYVVFPDFPQNKVTGYISKSLSTTNIENDSFLFEQAIEFVRTFSETSNVEELNFVFDTESYCNNLKIEWYDENGELLTQDLFYPDSHEYKCVKNVENVKYMKIIFYGMNKPNRYLRVYDIFDGDIIKLGGNSENKIIDLEFDVSCFPIPIDLPSSTCKVKTKFSKKIGITLYDIVDLYLDGNIYIRYYINNINENDNYITLHCIDVFQYLEKANIEQRINYVTDTYYVYFEEATTQERNFFSYEVNEVPTDLALEINNIFNKLTNAIGVSFIAEDTLSLFPVFIEDGSILKFLRTLACYNNSKISIIGDKGVVISNNNYEKVHNLSNIYIDNNICLGDAYSTVDGTFVLLDLPSNPSRGTIRYRDFKQLENFISPDEKPNEYINSTCKFDKWITLDEPYLFIGLGIDDGITQRYVVSKSLNDEISIDYYDGINVHLVGNFSPYLDSSTKSYKWRQYDLMGLKAFTALKNYSISTNLNSERLYTPPKGLKIDETKCYVREETALEYCNHKIKNKIKFSSVYEQSLLGKLVTFNTQKRTITCIPYTAECKWRGNKIKCNYEALIIDNVEEVID